MDTNAAAALLQRGLARSGEPVTLRRYTGLGSARTILTQVTIQGRVEAYQPSDLIAASGIVEGDGLLIVCALDLTAAGWPGGTAPAGAPPEWPWLIVGDEVLQAGRARIVKAVDLSRVAWGRVEARVR